jgi:transcriptional regulator with XRE-family HTH domain
MQTLRDARVRRLLSIRQLAKLAGVSPNTIQLLESGQRRASYLTMRKVANALNVEPNEITEFAAAIEAAREGKEAA